jgi:hypothetical protein
MNNDQEQSMTVPYPSADQPDRLRLLRALFDNGPMTRDDAIGMACADSHASPAQQAALKAKAAALLAGMLGDGQLFEQGGMVSLHEELLARMVDEAEAGPAPADLVPPRCMPAFRPISARHIPSARGPRDLEPAREFHPKTLSSNVPVAAFFDW